MLRGKKIVSYGKEYVFAPLNLYAVIHFEELMNIFHTYSTQEKVDMIIDMALESLIRNYPLITRDEVLKFVDQETLALVFNTILEVSGMISKPGENSNLEDSEKK